MFIAGDQVPKTPFKEDVGKTKESPEHIGPTCEKLGKVGWFTLTVIVSFVAHWPVVGVKVYVVVAKLFIAGDQLPVIPLLEFDDKVNESPEHIGATWVNNEAILGFTTTLIVAIVAHWLANGVKVYVVLIVVLIVGDQEPEIPFVDVVGKLKEPPEHIGDIWLKLGINGWLTTTVIVWFTAHWLGFGVNV